MASIGATAGPPRTTILRAATLLALAGGAAAICWQHGVRPAGAAQRPPVVVESNPATGERVYRVAEDGCTIAWTVYAGELNRGVVKCRSVCALPLSRQIPVLARIFGEFLAQDPEAPAFRTLFWGGLMPDGGPASLELPLRLALAAHRSPGWDAERGRPRSGGLNQFVEDLANSEPIYPELAALFAGAGRALSIASVEKVRVLAAGTLPFYGELRAAGVGAAERLPFDCLVWFSVSTAPAAPRR